MLPVLRERHRLLREDCVEEDLVLDAVGRLAVVPHLEAGRRRQRRQEGQDEAGGPHDWDRAWTLDHLFLYSTKKSDTFSPPCYELTMHDKVPQGDHSGPRNLPPPRKEVSSTGLMTYFVLSFFSSFYFLK